MKKKLITIINILIIMIFSISIIRKNFENDIFFDLKTAESILKYGIDFKDHFSFIPNLTYIYHHYLYDLIIYPIYILFKFHGLFIFFLIIFNSFGVLVYYINNKFTRSRFISLLVSLFTLYITSYAFQTRVQSITYILFFLEVYFLDRLYEKGEKKYSIFIILISILIANMHMPIWILTLILYLPFIFELVIKKILEKFSKLNNVISDKLIISYPKNNKLLIITFVILLFTGLLTPLKLYPYTFFTKSLFNHTFTFIGEMSKTVLYINGFLIFLLVMFILTIFIKNVKFKLRDLCLLIGLMLFSFIAERNVIFVYLFYPTILIKIVFESLDLKIKFKKLTKIFSRINIKVITNFTTVCLILIYIYLLFCMDFKKNDYSIKEDYPDECVEYIKQNLDYKNIRLYNIFGFGSYIEFNDIPVFLDSRAEVYIKEFNGGYDIISDFLKTKEYSTYKEVFDKYNFDYALVNTDSDIFSYLISDNFEIIFEEEGFSLLKRM